MNYGSYLTAAAVLAAVASDAGESRMQGVSWLENGRLRLGADLSIGGAITHLSEVDGPNVINSHDWGRQVQLSFYSGPSPFAPGGRQPSRRWAGLGWNPIQSGDCGGNRSRVVEHHNDGRTLYVKCIPMHWPHNNLPAQCSFECWYRLEGNTVRTRCRLTNHRDDHHQYAGRNQELPAVYTNGPWYKLVTYLGDQPFSGAPLTTLVDRGDGKGWPWRRYFASENWAALVDASNHGLGVWQPGAYRFLGGFAGKPKGKGGPKDGQTGYIAPVQDDILDHNIVYEYQYVLIVGSLTEIRELVCREAPKPRPPTYVFAGDRQHWTYGKTSDQGWPVTDGLHVALAAEATMRGPLCLWQAEDAPTLFIRAAFQTAADHAAIVVEPFDKAERGDWPAWGDGRKPPAKRPIPAISFPLVGDGTMRTYTVPLAGQPGYQGAMVRLSLKLPPPPGEGHIQAIGFDRKRVAEAGNRE